MIDQSFLDMLKMLLHAISIDVSTSSMMGGKLESRAEDALLDPDCIRLKP